MDQARARCSIWSRASIPPIPAAWSAFAAKTSRAVNRTRLPAAASRSPVNVVKLLGTVLSLKARYGRTVILVEHVMKLVMASCDVVTVLDHGEKIAEGPPEAIRDDHRVIEAYLGKEMKDAEVRA